jgi:hypothetical protein
MDNHQEVGLSWMIGDTVLLILKNYEELQVTGITTPILYAKLTGVEALGIWIENPRWETISLGTGAPEHYHCNVLVRFEYLSSVIHFPEREGFEAGEHAIGRIGFHH